MTARFQNLSALVLVGTIAGCVTGAIDPMSSPKGDSDPVGGAGTAASGGASSTPNTTPAKLDLSGAPKYFRVIRLSNQQWANSVQTVLGLATPTDLAQNFRAPVSGNSDFDNNELFLDIDNSSWQNFQAAAEALADQVTASDATLAKAYSGKDAAGLITTLGRRAYRRPLTSAEQSKYMTLYNSGSTLSGSRSALAKGASLVIRALLQSPNFLFRTELGAVGQPLSGFEMAAKLSLWLKNTSPDDKLLDAAAGSTTLNTPDGAVEAAKTMLEDGAAAKIMRSFHGQFLHLDLFSTITKNMVPDFNQAIGPELTESSYLFFDKIFSKNLGVKDIFLSTSGFVGPNMAAVYGNGVTVPSTGYTEQPLGDNRIGFFTQLPYPMYWGRNGGPDSIHRGVTLNVDVLCATLGPPSIVLPTLPERQPGQTNRDIVDLTTSGCGRACHNAMINPIGFAFEHYDGMGRYRTTEKDVTGAELTIDSSGTYTFTDGTKTYKDAGELMQAMANGQQAHACYAKKIASYGLQRDVVEADMPLLTALASPSMSNGSSVKQMILDLVKQDAFRTRSGGAQ